MGQHSPDDFDTNPQACPKCGFGPLSQEECPRCGVLVSKYQSIVEAAQGQGKGKALIYAKPSYRWIGFVVAGACLAAAAVLFIIWINASSAELELKQDSPLLHPPDAAGNAVPIAAIPVGEPSGQEEPQPDQPVPEPSPEVGLPEAPSPKPPKRPPPSKPYFASSWYEGAQGFDRAHQDQTDYGVPLAVVFFTDWCPNCKRMDREILGSAEASSYLSGVAKVRINPEKGIAEDALADRFGVKGYPAVFVAAPRSATFTKIPVPAGWDDASGRSPARLFVERCRKAATAP